MQTMGERNKDAEDRQAVRDYQLCGLEIMLLDADAIQKFLNAPPGQVVAGSILAGIVWKFFERIENVLSDQTKFEIAVWLVGIEVERKVHPWPETFSKLFYKTFGEKSLSWKAVCVFPVSVHD